MVENIQKQNMKVNARTVIDLILRQGVYEGRIAEAPKYKVKFAALWSMSDTEQADVAQKRAQVEQTKAQTIAAYLEQGVLDPEEVRRGLANKGPVEVEEIISEQDLASEGETLDTPESTLPTSPPAAENVESADSGSGKRDSTTAVEPEYEAAAVLIIKDGKALCAARRDQRGLCGPGGCLKPGESPEDAALRESQEEFNIVPLSLIPFGELQAATGRYLRTKLYFTDQFSGTPEADGMELIDERWVRIDELHKEPLFPAFEESLKLFRETLRPYVMNRADGSSGSGNWGHKGVPGQLGGSAPGGGVAHRTGSKESGYSSAAKERAKAKLEAKKSGASVGGGSGSAQNSASEKKPRYASKEEYQAAKAKAKSELPEKLKRIDEEYEQESTAIRDKYGSRMRQRMEIRRDESLTDEQKAQKLDELDRKFEKMREELEAVGLKRQTAYDKANEDCDRIFDPDYEYDKIAGSHTLKDDATAHVINPEGLFQNCQRCAVALEMRQRGYDVCASRGEHDELSMQWSIEQCFIGAAKADFGNLGSAGGDLTPQIRQQMLDWGEGSRALISCQYSRNGITGGHIYNLSVKDGEVFAADGQLGGFWSDKSTLADFGQMNLTSEGTYYATLIRTDNAVIGMNAEKYVRKAGD